MVKRSQRGFTMIEVVITLVIFGTFLIMLTTMTMEMRRMEKKYPINFLKHPQVIAVMTRLQRDVYDAFGPGNSPYPASFGAYEQSDKLLIVRTLVDGGLETVVWDFTIPNEVHRRAFKVGIATVWTARDVQQFEIDTFEIPGRPYGVRLRSQGSHEIDQIFQPRPHD